MTHRTGVIDLGSNTSRLVIYEHESGVRFRAQLGSSNGISAIMVLADQCPAT